MTKETFKVKKLIPQVVLLIVSVLLSALSHPNFLSVNGFGFLAWFSYLPLLLLIRKLTFKNCFIFSFFYAFLFCTTYGFWLINYGFFSYLVVLILNIIWYTILFYILKSLEKLYPKNSWVLAWLVICSFEYLKTKGFMGFNYGITAYSQWKYIPVIQITDITGVFGLNAIIIFPSCCIYGFLKKRFELKAYQQSVEKNLKQFEYESHFKFLQNDEKEIKKYSVKSSVFAFVLFIFAFTGLFIYSKHAQKDYSKNEQMKIAAIQNCDTPDKNGLESYIENFSTLYTLSDSVIEMNRDLQIILWPENSIVPSISFKYDYENNLKKLYGENREITDYDIQTENFIKRCVDYFSRLKKYTFIIGNNHMEATDDNQLVYYNAALVFDSETDYEPLKVQAYKKMHLVPFTEGFPYKNLFPKIYEKLYQKFDYLYEPGFEYTVFKRGNLRFSTPICFEDTFSDTARNMYKAGSRCFFNLTNDSWAENKVSQYQHMAISIFRAVENRVPLVRSAATGQTCIVDPNGRITQMVEPFTKYFVSGYIPVIDEERKPTFYAEYGYLIFEWGIVFLTLLLLIIRIIIVIINKIRKVQ